MGSTGRLIDDEEGIDARWLEGVRRVGLTAGASAPEDLVQGVIERLRGLGGSLHERVVIDEDVVFPLPPQLAKRAPGMSR